MLPFLSSLFRSHPSLWGTTLSHPSPDLAKFPQWLSLLSRHQQDIEHREDRERKFPKFKAWFHFLETIKSKPLNEQCRLVNDWTNTFAYIQDSKNWKQSDYWATPLELFTHGGDCEDYAAAKYLALKRLGVPVGNMRLVVLNDKQRRTGHAVLVVYQQKQVWMLDNQIKHVAAPNTVRHYQPVYSLNEQGYWYL
jgi:predicted transglutaminase-like cysteine proteinase